MLVWKTYLMDNGLNLVQVACDAALAAGKEILKVYDTEFEVEWKQDQSPVTTADKKASVIIRRILDLTEIKVVCEEGDGHDFEGRKGCSQIWLVDPIDGTKEFIKRNGEFTVNIALVENGRPLLGIVYAPVLKLLYVASEATGALKFTNVEPSDAVKLNEKERLNSAQKLPLQKLPEVYTVAISRT
jgi:3'(2'), 5'-bisphosphate nucleotidase